MSKWKKRTNDEIETSVRAGDYTGGYEFWPWLFYMRKMYVVGFFANLSSGWIGGLSMVTSDPSEWVGYGVIGFFGVLAPILIAYMLRKDYAMSKKGKSM
jgi:hypothetical protein